jgi:NADH dehydrogenase
LRGSRGFYCSEARAALNRDDGMRNRRVVVMGASGFVGRYAVRDLARSGAVITALGRSAFSAGYLRPMGDVGQIAAIDCDIGDEKRLRPLLSGADAVVNAAGIVFERGKQRFAAIHEQGPALLARLASEAGIRHFVHVSALGADDAAPSFYARSKAKGEWAVRQAFPGAVILRPALIFGPEDQFFNRFAALARFLPVLPLIGGGATRFQPVYVGDVAAAILAVLDDPASAGRTYDLAGPEIYTLEQLFQLILKQTGRRRWLVPVPFGIAAFHAALHDLLPLPNPLITRDQVRMLRRDSVAEPGVPGLNELGVMPTALELLLPTYLGRYRRPRDLGIAAQS